MEIRFKTIKDCLKVNSHIVIELPYVDLIAYVFIDGVLCRFDFNTKTRVLTIFDPVFGLCNVNIQYYSTSEDRENKIDKILDEV